MDSIRIFIVDDHEIVRDGIRTLIATKRPTWIICGEAADGTHAIDDVQACSPDVVILDITMPGANGMDVARKLLALVPATRILMFTMHESTTVVEQVREVGAHGIVLKSQASRDLIHAIERLMVGGTFFPEIATDETRSPELGQKITRLRRPWNPWKTVGIFVFG
jgi:DNA-binding NarL/FixJ family response regulator